MSQALRRQSSPAYDANLLFDELLRRFALGDDDGLSEKLHIGRGLLARIRRGESRLTAPLLIRISEHAGIPVAKLRRMAGDRRAEFRLEEADHVATQSPAPARPLRAQTGLVRDDPGLPANVQWT